MKLTRKRVLIALSFALASLVILYGYRTVRAERHRLFDRACASGDTDRVALLLRLGADPNGIRDSHYYVRYAWTVLDSTPPLHLAAAGGYGEVVRLLLASGANSTARATEQLTAGDLARLQGHVEVAQLLDTAQRK